MAGEVFLQQGDPATHFYIVKSGQLASSFVASTGEEVELSVLHAGEQFGTIRFSERSTTRP